MKISLSGRNALITGASQGLGRAIALAYAKAGAGLMLCARNADLLEESRKAAAQAAGPEQVIAACPADISNEQDVQHLMNETFSRFPRLHILVNNAGVYGPKGCIEEIDWKEWVRALEINLYGSVLMCRAVLPHFKRFRYGKIIQLSGGGATNPLPRISAYAASKAAVVRFSETLAEEVRQDRIDVNSIAPGALNTRLLDEVLEAGPEKVGPGFYQRAIRQRNEGGVPLDRGADLAVYLGAEISDGLTGKLLSAIWDPWEDLGIHAGELKDSDIYTLRRIVPADRGKTWGDRQ